jgi:thiamine pyrophosphokinase
LLTPDDTIICADGGTLHALELGLRPDLIVGDLDSLPAHIQAELTKQGIEIQTHPVRKDQTDLELAFHAAINRGATEIILLTALGGRLDQQLANLLLLARPEWSPVRLGLADGNQRAWLMRGPDELTLTGEPGDTFSFVAFSETVTGIDLEQVEWPLHDVTIHLGSTLTISNRFLGKEMIVRIKTGIGLAIQMKGEAF